VAIMKTAATAIARAVITIVLGNQVIVQLPCCSTMTRRAKLFSSGCALSLRFVDPVPAHGKLTRLSTCALSQHLCTVYPTMQSTSHRRSIPGA
jgi:hypothetical protein